MNQAAPLPPEATLRALVDNLIDESLLVLKKDRDRVVVAKRHGIKSHAPHTLEQIGSELGITRERVRQIEKAAISKIREQFIGTNQARTDLIKHVDAIGGLSQLETVAHELHLSEADLPNLAYLVRITPEVILVEQTDEIRPLVASTDLYEYDSVVKLHQALTKVLADLSKPSKFDKIHASIDGPHTASALQELAGASKRIANLDGVWGLISWPEVNPKSIRDKTYLVLKKAGRPMHFTEIADKITRLQANPKSVTTQAVHNELIKDARFVLIGRGIYALAEWGYQAGTVADIITQILQEEPQLSREEIIKRVLSRRQVKVATIALNLQEKPQFERVSKGMYKLRDNYVPEPRKRRGRPAKHV
ncbi:MAG: sigma factor-like helix-turn-helix DNA-binding protein [bacterium]